MKWSSLIVLSLMPLTMSMASAMESATNDVLNDMNLKKDMDMDMDMDMGKIHSSSSSSNNNINNNNNNNIINNNHNNDDHDHDMKGTMSVNLELLPDESSTIIPTPHVMKHHHGVPILQTHLQPAEKLWWEKYSTHTFFDNDDSLYLYLHTVIGLITFIGLYPILLVLKNVGSNWYLKLLCVHMGLLLTSSIFFWKFDQQNLYPGNVYNGILITLVISSIIHFLSAFIHLHNYDYVPLQNQFEIDSPSSSMELNETQWKNLYSNNSIDFKNKLANFLSTKFNSSWLKSIISIIFNVLNWVNFTIFLVIFPTAVTIFGEFGKGNALFNLLAHFIKGGVFIVYGLITLARYCGAFENKGWSWNHKFITSKNDSHWQTKGTITMEFVESFLIFFYGSTNIFLERLASSNSSPWSPKDLQHASIAFIFIGCGLCGLICEFKLNDWRFEKSIDNQRKIYKKDQVDYENNQEINQDNLQSILKSSPGFSPNPFPTITIFCTGVLMSKHQQSSSLSTEIHTLWGTLFMFACGFRLLTYILMLILPINKKLTSPSRPFTEILTSFSLILGGLMFMESTDPLVLAYEYHGYTSMFILNVSLGIIALLMAWEMSLFAFKDWLKNK